MNSRQPLKILHIASGDLWAGAEVQLYTLASQQHMQDNTLVRVILLNPGRLQQELLNRGIEVDIIDESHHHAGTIFWRMLALLRKHRPHIVHTHRIKENILGGLAACLCRIPSLRTTHGAPEHDASWRRPHKKLQHWLDRTIGQSLQRAVIAVSDELADKLAQHYPANKIHVIENGLDINHTRQQAQLQADKSGGHKTTDDNRLTIGLVGRLVEVKRVDLFIDIASRTAQIAPDIRFRVYGDGPLRETLQQYCQTQAASRVVKFMGHSDHIQRDLQQLDILLITSDHEGLPMVLLEAMALHTVVIAHAVGAIPQVLDYGRCGILIRGQNPDDYVKTIVELAVDRQQLQSLAGAATQRLNSHYSAASNAQRCLNLYNQCRS